MDIFEYGNIGDGGQQIILECSRLRIAARVERHFLKQHHADRRILHRIAETLFAAPIGITEPQREHLGPRLRARERHHHREHQQRGQHAGCKRDPQLVHAGRRQRADRLEVVAPDASVQRLGHAVKRRPVCIVQIAIGSQHRPSAAIRHIDVPERQPFADRNAGTLQKFGRPERSEHPPDECVLAIRPAIGQTCRAVDGREHQDARRPLMQGQRRAQADLAAVTRRIHRRAPDRIAVLVVADHFARGGVFGLEIDDGAVVRADAARAEGEQALPVRTSLELQCLQRLGRQRCDVAQALQTRQLRGDIQTFDVSPPLSRCRRIRRRTVQGDTAAQAEFVLQHPLADGVRELVGLGHEACFGQSTLALSRIARVQRHEQQRADQHQHGQHVTATQT